MYKNGILVFFLLLSLSSCSIIGDLKSNKTVIIRYVNVKKIFSFLLDNDKKALNLFNKKRNFETEIFNLKQKNLKIFSDRADIEVVLNNKLKLYKEINIKWDDVKKKFYKKIDRSIKRVAKRIDADYILNLGNQVVYAKGNFNVTNFVILDLVDLEKRYNPVNR